jgi:lysophospholipase L1-like esterase
VIRSVVISILIAAGALAQDPGGKLPRVLIIGDSISMGYTEPLKKLLAGIANVQRIGENGGPTTNGVAHLDQLPPGPWQVVTFNFGLHDLKLDTGSHQVDLPQYEANLKTIADALRKTGAKLIWVTTTPVPRGNLNPKRERADVPLYNEAAARVLKGKVDAVCDLYSAVLSREPDLQLKENVHFTVAGYDFLAEQVAAAVRTQLAAPAR